MNKLLQDFVDAKKFLISRLKTSPSTTTSGDAIMLSDLEKFMSDKVVLPREASDYVYEVIDETNEECWYPMGIYRTFSDAYSQIVGRDNDYPMTNNDEQETVVIRKRKFDRPLSDYEYSETVYTITREDYYDEETDSSFWRVVHETSDSDIKALIESQEGE